jgi:hypothetical protein
VVLSGINLTKTYASEQTGRNKKANKPIQSIAATLAVPIDLFVSATRTELINENDVYIL